MKSAENSILLVSPLPPPIGGITSWTVDYLRQMEMMGESVSLVNTSVTGKRLTNNSKLNFFDEIRRLKTIRKEITQKVGNGQCKVMHYNASCFTLGLIRDYAVLRKFVKRIPVVYQCHCNLETNINNSIAKYFFKKVCKKVKVVLTLNKKSEEYARKFTKNVITVPNFITRLYRSTPDVSLNLKNIVYVGRVSGLKGVYEIIGAANRIPEVTFNIIGPDDSHILNDVKLKNIVYHGSKTHDEVLSMLQTMDALILPSYSEGFPLVVLEAMSCGLPIIATSVGSIPDMIENKGGILVEVKSVDDLVKAIRHIEPMSIRKEMAAYNICKVRDEYLCENVLSALTDIYKGVL